MGTKKSVVFWVVFFVLLLAILSYKNIRILDNSETRQISIYVEIANYTDVKEGNNSLYFFLPAGKEISGKTIVKNTENEERKIKVFLVGKIADDGWLFVSEEQFKLKANETRVIEMTIKVPEYASGNYTARMIIKGKKV